MKKRNGMIMLAVIIMFLFFVPKFTSIDTPPSVNFVQTCFNENREDILAIVSYVYKSGYHDMYISDSTGQAYADFTTVSISDNDVCNAIRRLFKNNTYLQISKMDQTISFLQWTGLRDIGCGILFSKNVEESIESEFITELIPLSEKDWFYYVSDYNAWRIGERATIDRKME